MRLVSIAGLTNLFADDTSAFVIDKSLSSLSGKLQNCVDTLSCWFDTWLLSVNTSKSAFMVLRSRGMSSTPLQLSLHGCAINQVCNHKHLSLTMSETLTWSAHVDSVISKASTRIGFLRRLKHRTSPLVVRELYLYCIRPIMEYASVAWAGLTKTNVQHLGRCNRNAARLITGISPSADVPNDITLARAGLSTLKARRCLAQAQFVHRLLAGHQPRHLRRATCHWLDPRSGSSMVLRSQDSLHSPASS